MHSHDRPDMWLWPHHAVCFAAFGGAGGFVKRCGGDVGADQFGSADWIDGGQRHVDGLHTVIRADDDFAFHRAFIGVECQRCLPQAIFGFDWLEPDHRVLFVQARNRPDCGLWRGRGFIIDRTAVVVRAAVKDFDFLRRQSILKRYAIGAQRHVETAAVELADGAHFPARRHGAKRRNGAALAIAVIGAAVWVSVKGDIIHGQFP